MTKEELNDMTGAELLRLIVQNINTTHESFNDQYSLDELIQIHKMFLLSDWDIYPDDWTKRQVKKALQGIPPQWTKNEKPKYSKHASLKDKESPVLFQRKLFEKLHSVLLEWTEKTDCASPFEAALRIKKFEDRIDQLEAELECAREVEIREKFSRAHTIK